MTDPLERTVALLSPARRPAAPDAPDGYLDLLGDGAPPVRTVSQRLMRATPLVAVYERWWRPALGRVFMGGPWAPDTAEERRIARSLLELGEGDGVLDVACGTGAFTRDFAATVGPTGLAVGLDASAPMLQRAARSDRPPSVAWVRGDATAMPFRDESFDAVCCFAALYLIDDVAGALDEMTRVLRHGGRLALLSSARAGRMPLRLLDRPAAAVAGVTLFERDELTRALRDRGFVDVEQRVAGFAQFVGARRGGVRPAGR